VAEDFDRDGSVDLVAAGSDQSAFLHGDGRGRFKPLKGKPPGTTSSP
jgi:hypothetical protein